MRVQSEVLPLRRALVKHARDAFVDGESIALQWEALGYSAPPEYDAACREFDAFASLLESLGVALEWMPREDVGLDSIYVRDASLVTDQGVVLCRMGKQGRAGEPEGQRRVYAGLDIPILGAVDGEGKVEGGDATWLDDRTLVLGRGYRTNDEGIRQVRALLPEDVEVVTVALAHWRGPGDVFHLMSIVSPLAADLLLVYSPLLSVPFRELLIDRGFELVEVPDEEFDSMGCNVLTISPRVAVAMDGNPETRRRMEAAGVEVHTYEGAEISGKGCGGPTCLTRTLERGP